jgi:hypothetical protein
MNVPELKLVRERKIRDLVPRSKSIRRWEASGVLVKPPHFYVAFDDRTEIAQLSDDLEPAETNALVGLASKRVGYEGIAYNDVRERYYLLVEAREQSTGCCQAEIFEFDRLFKHLKNRSLDFTFKSANKGFEALAHLRRSGQDYVLALCEGNKCKCGAKGRKPGGGRVQLFEKQKKRWAHLGPIDLPPHLPFVDYSGMAVDRGRVAIVSQVTSMLWVGQFDEADWEWRDDGRLFNFPRFDDGAIRYGNIEGVAWVSPTRIVTVSDRRKKKEQPDERLSKKDQSIHIFDVPEW